MLGFLRPASMPIVWVVALVALGLMLVKFPRRRPYPKHGWFLVLMGLVVLYLLSVAPVSKLLAYSLESRYKLPSDEVLSTLDVVVVLGGGMEASGGLRDYPEPSGITYSRLVSGVRIFKRSGAKTLVLSGGGPPESTESEAGVMKDLTLELGVQEDRILIETHSQNTMQQAVNLAELLAGTEGRRIGLVTSALHMMRSEKAFKARFPEDTIVPVPVGYICGPRRWRLERVMPTAGALLTSTYALHEWIGMIWYPIRY